MQDKLAYSEPEAAKLAGIGRTKLREEIQHGRLTAKRIGKRIIIAADDLQLWIERLPPAAQSNTP
jgi:excisionase family DNA binding protein